MRMMNHLQYRMIRQKQLDKLAAAANDLATDHYWKQSAAWTRRAERIDAGRHVWPPADATEIKHSLMRKRLEAERAEEAALRARLDAMGPRNNLNPLFYRPQR